MKISNLIGETINLRIKEVFGTVRAKLLKIDSANGLAHISFKSFGSSYYMAVPVSALSTKNTEGEAKAFVPNAEVTVTLDTSEIVSKKVKCLDIGDVGILAQLGNNVRLFPWDSIKEVRYSVDSDNKPAKAEKPAKPAVGKPVAAKPAPGRPAAPGAPRR
jgi:hypothetical protein